MKGDSGGPAFINGQVAGVASLTYDMDGDNKFADFGSVQVWARHNTWVQAFLSESMNPNGVQSYALKLDMNNQDAVGDGSADEIEITKTSSGGLDVINVSLNGQVIHQGLLQNITSITIIGSSDDDTLKLSSSLFLWNNTNIPLSFDGQGGSDTLEVAGPAGPPLNWEITGSDAGDVGGTTFFNVENLQGGNSDDAFMIKQGGSISEVVDGGAGQNTLDYTQTTSTIYASPQTGSASFTGGINAITKIFANTAGAANHTLSATYGLNLFNVTGFNSGMLNGLKFLNFGNLSGGIGNDEFRMQSAGSLSGSISGMSGLDLLNYQYRATPVVVNLVDQSATDVPSFSSIEQFFGSESENDVLVHHDGADVSYTDSSKESGHVKVFDNSADWKGGGVSDSAESIIWEFFDFENVIAKSGTTEITGKSDVDNETSFSSDDDKSISKDDSDGSGKKAAEDFATHAVVKDCDVMLETEWMEALKTLDSESEPKRADS